MNNKLLSYILALFFLSLSVIAQEQGGGTGQPSKTRVGVGISLEPLKLFAIGSGFVSNAQTPVNIYVPIALGRSTTIEPEFGIFSFSSESGSSGSTNKTSASVIRFGAGILMSIASSSSVRVYAGPRIGVYLVNSESSSSSAYGSSSSETSETDLTFGAGLGGEYLISEQMSVGGEALITYYSFGEPKRTPSSSSSSSFSQSMITSNVLFFLRWYF